MQYKIIRGANRKGEEIMRDSHTWAKYGKYTISIIQKPKIMYVFEGILRT